MGEAKAQRFKCDQCAAEMTFDAASQKLKCAFCGFVKDVPSETGAVVEHDIFAGLATAPSGFGASDSRISRCQECGANVAFSGNLTATKCTFCGSSRVLEQSENLNALRPESLLAFAVDKKSANDHFA